MPHDGLCCTTLPGGHATWSGFATLSLSHATWCGLCYIAIGSCNVVCVVLHYCVWVMPHGLGCSTLSEGHVVCVVLHCPWAMPHGLCHATWSPLILGP